MRTLLIFTLLFLFTKLYSAVNRIDMVFEGLENQKIILAVQYGKKQIALDTTQLDSTGQGHFHSPQKYPGGLYLLVLPDKKFYEFLIDNEQYFTLRSQYKHFFDSMSIEGAEMTNLYHNYQKKALEIQQKINSTIAIRKTVSKDSSVILMHAIERLTMELKFFRSNVVKNLPNSFIAHLFQLLEEPEDTTQNTNIDKNAISNRYNYLVMNYFKNFVFNDERLLRTSIFEEKIDFYFNRLINQKRDTIIRHIDLLLSKASKNEQVNRFILNYLTGIYRNNQHSQSDYIYLHLIDQYYLAGKAPWADPRYLKLMKDRADNIRTTLIGSKAPDLKLETMDNKNISLYNVDANWIVLYFWSPDCEKCQLQTPIIDKIYKKYKSKGIKIFAVFTYADRAVWIDAIKNQDLEWIHAYDPLLKSNFSKLYKVNDTPTLYLLDKDKKIALRNTEIEDLEKFIDEKLKK